MTAALAVPVAGQANGGFGQPGGAPAPGSNPFLGTWVSQIPAADGVMVIYSEYTADGTARSTAVMQGGSLSGARFQIWGKYTARQTGGGWTVVLHPAGQAPLRICAQGGGCQPSPPLVVETTTVDRVDENTFHGRSVAGSNVIEVSAQRSPIPPQLMQPLGPVLTFSPPSPPAGGGGGGGSGTGGGGTAGGGARYVSPPMATPGLGGNCDDLQQQRICTINDGHIYIDRRGCKVCAAP